MKKNLIIGGIIIILIFAIAIFFFRKTPSGSSGGVGTTGTLPPAIVGSSTYTPPAGNTFSIGTPQGTVTVNNFYNNAQQISADHTSVLIQQTSAYNIDYYVPDSSFNILVLQTPFETIRQQAEAAFLQTLGISQADACKLKVKVGTLISVDPNYAGQNIGLSFCSGGAFQ